LSISTLAAEKNRVSLLQGMCRLSPHSFSRQRRSLSSTEQPIRVFAHEGKTMIDKAASTPLYQQIQNYIVERIRSGDLPAGSQVPSEFELSAQMQVSRMTARKALDSLVSSGILYRRRGKGTYVATSVVDYNLTTMQSFSRTLRSRGYDVTTRVLVVESLPAPPEIAQQLHLDVGIPLLMIRRLRLVGGIPAAIHTAYLNQAVYGAVAQIDLSIHSLLDSMQQITGQPMVYTIDAVQADSARSEEARLLDIPKDSPVLRVEGVSYLEYGEPTRYVQAVYRGDMFKLTVRNTSSLAASLNIATQT
jgi:GntR family transcriptional regulator